MDSKKLADKISKYEKEQNLKTKLFIQVNIGNEKQKSGILKSEVVDFYNYCKSLEFKYYWSNVHTTFNKDSTSFLKK